MSVNVTSEDLFGGLSDSDSEEYLEDVTLPDNTRQSMDLLDDLAMSGSSDEGDVNDDEEEEVGAETSGPADDSARTPDTYRETDEDSPVLPDPYLDEESSSTAGFHVIPEAEPVKNMNSSGYYFDEKQRKRKLHGEDQSAEDIHFKSEDADESVDSLDALTTLFDSAPRKSNSVKRRPLRKREIAFPVEQGTIVNCPSSSTPVQKVMLHQPKLASQNEPLRPKSAKEKAQELIQLEHLVLLGNFSKNQLERYEVYRRSTFNKSAIKKIIEKFAGAPAGDQLVVSMRSLAKMLVGDLVEEAVELREALGETDKPIQPHHIKMVFKKLVDDGKLWPPYGSNH